MEVQDRVLSEDWNSDLIVRAKTGSGKTLAFLLPLLQEMKIGERLPQILILAPTRELAQQTADEANFLGRFLSVSCASLVGGMDIVNQLKTLRHGAAIIAGTPGRVRDHIQRGTLKTDEIHSVVLDEGDLMLDMGFREELEAILDSVPKGRRWLFSATMPLEVRELAGRYLNDPVTLSVDDESDQHDAITHRVYRIPSQKRFEGLVDILLWEHPS
ncbi:MAG: DEAD/DEAH box helicase, partial [Synergistaceae bacterium]|nr:DEAD/DEAH box helicase [Synergistaceae bacterium]